MRFYFTLLFIFFCLAASAQTNNAIYGNWIKAKVTYKNGRELTDDNTLKYEYMRYTFGKPDLLSYNFTYDTKADDQHFSVGGNLLYTKNAVGYVMNTFLISKITKDSLILIQEGTDGFDSPDCLKYYYVAESKYQQSIPLKPADIISVKGADTVFKQSKKIYPEFKGTKGYHELEAEAVSGLHDQEPLNNHFVATFIVNKAGGADSLHIISGINPDFDKQYTRAFIKAKKYWAPALYHGRPVSVLMKDEFKFIPGDKYPAFERYTGLGNTAMNQGDYKLAIYNYDKAIASYAEGDVLYKRAICKLVLGDDAGACEDIQRSIDQDYSAAIGLKEKYCH